MKTLKLNNKDAEFIKNTIYSLVLEELSEIEDYKNMSPCMEWNSDAGSWVDNIEHIEWLSKEIIRKQKNVKRLTDLHHKLA